MRSPDNASFTICRYRGSKMCSGRNTLGNITTFGSGKIGIVAGSIMWSFRHLASWLFGHLVTGSFRLSVNRARLLLHVIRQHVLAERVRRSEVSLPATH